MMLKKKPGIASICKIQIKKYLFYFFIGILLSGCYSSRLVTDQTEPHSIGNAIARIDLKNGRTLDFKDNFNSIRLIKIDKDTLFYKNTEGKTYSLPVKEFVRFYISEADPWKSAITILGLAAAVVLLLFKF